MREKIKYDSGFTLVELIIAMAILAFLMTSVSAFMSSGVYSFKKTKADERVYTSAQETYNQITGSIMEANNLIIYGYKLTGATAPDFNNDTGIGLSNLKACYFIKYDPEDIIDPLTGKKTGEKDKAKDLLPTLVKYNVGYDSAAEIVYFKDLGKDTKIYVKSLIIDASEPIDMSYVSQTGPKYTNEITGVGNFEIVQPTRDVLKADGTTVNQGIVNSAGEPVYNINDTRRDIYTFDDESLYYEREYAFMTDLNDYKNVSDSSDEMKNYIYSKSIKAVDLTNATGDVTGKKLSGCVATVDAENGSIGFDIFFSDKNMTYTTNGMTKIQNSYVLKAKQ